MMIPSSCQWCGRLAVFLIIASMGGIVASAAETNSLHYDAAGRLIRTDYGNGRNVQYVYDRSGNVVLRLVEQFTDTDNDKMDDAWEMTNFETTDRDGTDDFDHDGFTDLEEFIAGTDPKDAASLLRFSSPPSPNSNGLIISWQSVPGKRYRLLFKGDLTDAAWIELATDIQATGQTTTVVDESATAATKKGFYRVQIVP